jgi:hypothetical protein
MASTELIRWFHREFRDQVRQATRATPFTPELVASIAVKEVGYLISRMRADGLSTDHILVRCVGDTKERRPGKFPSNRADLESVPDGRRMFEAARRALELVKPYSGGSDRAFRNPDKFCRGYGIFQYDLQFFRRDKEFFLNQGWSDFSACLERFIRELYEAMARIDWERTRELTEADEVGVGIAYNAGRYYPARGLAQGNLNRSTQRYYGQELAELVAAARGLNLDWGD